MSGHSKWSNIKHKKAAEDAKRGKVFTKIANAITSAAREGKSADIDSNPSLRLAVEKAKEVNMPKDKIQKAIDRAFGVGNEALENVVYEFYGPNGVAFIVSCLTDNKNRTATNIRSLLNKHNLSLGTPGSAGYIFNNGVPSFKIDLDDSSKEQIQSLLDDIEDSLEELEDVLHNASI